MRRKVTRKECNVSKRKSREENRVNGLCPVSVGKKEDKRERGESERE